MKDKTQPDNGTEAKISISLTSDWATHTIPLSKFTGAKLDQLYFVAEFVFSGAEPVTAFVRSVKFSDMAVSDTDGTRVEPLPESARREVLSGVGPVPGFALDAGSASAGSGFVSADARSNSMRIAFPPNQSFGFVTLRPANSQAMDVSAFQTLLIEMRGGPGTVRVGIKDFPHRNGGSEVRVSVPLTPEWRTYAFPLSLFTSGANAQDLRQMFVLAELVNESQAAVTAFVRRVRYSTAPVSNGIADALNPAALGGSVAVHSSIALDTRDRPYVSYFDLDAQELYVAWRAEQFAVAGDGRQTKVSRWLTSRVPPGAGDEFGGEYTSIEADDLDNVHLAYWTLSGPRYARINGVDDRAPILSERIEDQRGAGMYVSLDVVRTGATLEPRVAYYDSRAAEAGVPAGRVKLAVRRNGTWLPPDTVDGQGDVGGFASLKSDAGGRALVAYYDFDRGRIRIATSEPV